MDILLGIFTKLGADTSLFYQFAVVCIMVFACKFLFLGHMQKIIEMREEKTVGLEDNSNKKLAEITKIENEYKVKIQSANKEAKQKIESLKSNIISREEGKYRSKEVEISSFVEASKKENEADIQAKKESVLSEAQKLSNTLVQKFTKG